MATISVCWVCGQGLPDREARRTHYATVHPGYRVTWRNRNPLVIEPGGVEREITRNESGRMMRAAASLAAGRTPGSRKGIGGWPKGRPRKVRIESLGPAPSSDPAVSAEPDAGTPPIASAGPTRIAQPPVHPTVSAVQVSVRDAVRDALDVTMLATIIRDFSVNLSEADGAGEAGQLSLTQAATIAKLAYDSIVDVIVDRFGGNVGRFKLALAVMVLVLAKGSVHARAIGARIAERRTGSAPRPVPPPPADDVPRATSESYGIMVDDAAGEYATPIPDDPEPAPIPFATLGEDAPPAAFGVSNGHVTADEITAANRALAARQNDYLRRQRSARG